MGDDFAERAPPRRDTARRSCTRPRALAGAQRVPVVGGIVATFISEYVPRRKQARLVGFVQDLGRQFEAERARIDAEFVRSSEFDRMVEDVLSTAFSPSERGQARLLVRSSPGRDDRSTAGRGPSADDRNARRAPSGPAPASSRRRRRDRGRHHDGGVGSTLHLRYGPPGGRNPARLERPRARFDVVSGYRAGQRCPGRMKPHCPADPVRPAVRPAPAVGGR